MGNRTAVEWWTTLTNQGSAITLAGAFILTFDSSGLCHSLRDAAGISKLWLARLDGRLPPRQIPNIEAKQPRFGPDDAI